MVYIIITENRRGIYRKIGDIMDTKFKGFFASAMIFSMLASGGSTDSGNNNNSNIRITSDTLSSVTMNPDDDESDNDSESEECFSSSANAG